MMFRLTGDGKALTTKKLIAIDNFFALSIACIWESSSHYLFPVLLRFSLIVVPACTQFLWLNSRYICLWVVIVDVHWSQWLWTQELSTVRFPNSSWRNSAFVQQRPHPPVRPIPSQLWCKNFGNKEYWRSLQWRITEVLSPAADWSGLYLLFFLWIWDIQLRFWITCVWTGDKLPPLLLLFFCCCCHSASNKRWMINPTCFYIRHVWSYSFQLNN